MTRINKDKCDNCGKETDDNYEEVGWITVKFKELRVSAGRYKGRTAQSWVYESGIEKDFCCKDCFFEFVNKKIKAGKAKLKRAKKG
jgi:hypothetical protein